MSIENDLDKIRLSEEQGAGAMQGGDEATRISAPPFIRREIRDSCGVTVSGFVQPDREQAYRDFIACLMADEFETDELEAGE